MRPTQKVNVGYMIKTLVCVIAFLASVLFFAQVCNDLVGNYLILILPTVKITVPWLVQLCVAVLLIIVTLGITAVLVRPLWLTLIIYFLGSMVFALFTEGSPSVWIAAIVLFVSFTLYVFFIAKQLNNQINFSSHPLGDKKILICSVLAVLVSVSFGLGYVKDSTRRGYLIPPEIEASISNQVLNQTKDAVEKQKASAKEKQAALKTVQEKIQTAIDDTIKKIQPYQRYIPPLLGITAFFLFQMIFFILEIVASIMFGIIFFVLRKSHFAHVSSEMREITHLTLK